MKCLRLLRRFTRRSISLLGAAVLMAVATQDANAAPLVWAVGAHGTIVVSTDFGATWTSQASGTSQDLRGVDFFDASYGVAVGAGGTLLRTIEAAPTGSPGRAESPRRSTTSCCQGR